MKTKSFYFILMFLLLFFSCEKDDPQPVIVEETYQESYEIDQDLIIGRGYDIFDNYADVKMVRGSILDYNMLLNDGVISKNNIESAVFKTISGNTIDTYLEEMGWNVDVELKKKKVFSGSVDVNFNRAQSGNSSNSFATVQSTINKKLIKIKDEYTSSDLKGYLAANFKEDLNNTNISPEELFERYGTHCLSSIIIGGRLDYNISVNSNFIASSSSLAVQAEFEFKKSVGIGGGYGDSSSNTSTNEYMEKRLIVYGGRCEYGQNIINSDDYSNWVESIHENSVFCEFGNKPFIPIWDFCDSDSRKSEISAAFTDWSNERIYIPDTEIDTIEYEFNILDFKLKNGDSQMMIDDYDRIAELSTKFELLPTNDGNIKLLLYFYLEGWKNGSNQSIFEETKEIIIPFDTDPVYGILGDLNKEYDIQFYSSEDLKFEIAEEILPKANEHSFTDWYKYIDSTLTENSTDFFTKKSDTFIKHLEFRVDSKNKYDWGHVGLRGKLKIPVLVQNR